MNSITMSKSEAVVLFDLTGASSIPVGINDLPDVSEFEYQRIVDSFSAKYMIDPKSETFRPDMGLERFLLPIIKAKSILIFNFGIGDKCTFNASLYFAQNNLVALLDNQDGSVMFIVLSSIDDLLLFIPDITTIVGTSNRDVEHYISYLHLSNDGSSIIHCTKINAATDNARIVEGKRIPDDFPLESEIEVNLSDYKEMLHNKFKEVYNATGC